MSKSIAVCISDIHFNTNNLELSTEALQAAIDCSNELQIPLIIAGDLHDTKAIIRAEVANRLLDIFDSANQSVVILVGNHDLINEKGKEHGLNYLKHCATIVDRPTFYNKDILLIPYQSTPLTHIDSTMAKIIIMHQGVKGAWMGDYVQDKTSVDPTIFSNFKVISGHYHKHQTIGTVTYIGNPYTMSFGEANDGPKGFLVLNSDGMFERRILNLRKHTIIERTVENAHIPEPGVNSNDLLWLKITGSESELSKLDKKSLGLSHLGHSNFKLDLIPVENDDIGQKELSIDKMTDSQVFDNIVDGLNDSEDHRDYLKRLWRDLYEAKKD